MAREVARTGPLLFGALLAGAVGGASALARDEPPRRDDPEIRETVRRLEEPATSGPVYLPEGERDRREAEDGRPPQPDLLREGAFLLDRRGILVPVSGDRWAFVFDADASGASEPPMIVQPCLRLSEMVRLARTRAGTPTFLVSGRVYVYRGRNYLLPHRFSTLAAAPDGPDAAEVVREADAALRDPGAAPGDPSVEELLRRLEDVSGERQELLTRDAGPGGARLGNEGRMIVSRRGRLTQADRGLWTLVTDNGPDDAEEAAGPLVLMPCLTSESMGRFAERHGDRISFVVSGALYAFDGRAYLLPTLFQIERDRAGELIPAQ